MPPSAVLELQRTAGNGSVARALERASIQRNGESAAILEQLATPQVKPGPVVEVQQELVRRLEAHADINGLTIANLGGIELTSIPESDEELIRQARLVNLYRLGRKANFVSAGSPRYEAAVEAGAERLVIENTLRTMISAGQIAYLRKSGVPNRNWKVLVEVHYYRDRPQEQTGFHKDTEGQTLFVNLNYHIPQRVVGPEVVINPLASGAHDARTAQSLPPEFLQDLAAVRASLPEPTRIEASIVDPYGFVAFVDEAVHHATPFYGHRFVLGSEFETFLTTTYPAELAEARKGYGRWKTSWWPAYWWPFSTYVDQSVIPAGDSQKWLKWMEMLDDGGQTTKYTRTDFEASGMSTDEVDRMLEVVGGFAPRQGGGAGGFQKASVPKSGLVPIKRDGRPPLKRTLSDPDFRKRLPAPLPADQARRFFRTWVRVLPASVDLSA